MDNRKDWYDELMAKCDIVSIMSDYVTLKKKGSTHWACCPFHHEKTPSFSVSEQKQLYYCFGCQESGNVITFIKKMEGVEFGDAVKILAKKVGVEIPANNFTKKDNAQIIKQKERLYTLMRESAKFYNANLNSKAGEKAKQYLHSRGFTDNIIMRFGIGYSTNGHDIINHLAKKGFTKDEMKNAGMVAVSEKGPYDAFYGRVMFPIISNMGEVVAFGGRTLEEKPTFAKYKNSSQTLIFDKSKIIYGINLLKKKKQKEKIDYVILCEGYIDVIALHSAGFDTAVASMGTALTYNQAKQIKNFVDKVYISYDGDTAGQKAALKGLDILASAGLNVRVISLPQGQDPDDVIKTKGANYYKKLLEQAVTLPAFKIEALRKQHDMSDMDSKAKFAVESVKVVKALENPVEQEQYLEIIHKITNYSIDSLLRQSQVTKVAKEVVKEDGVVKDKAKEFSAEDFVVSSVVNKRDYVDFGVKFKDFISSELSRMVINYCVKNYKNNNQSLAPLFDEIGQENLSRLTEIINYKFLDGDNKEKYDLCIIALREKALRHKKDILAQKYNAESVTLSKEEKAKILGDISKIDKDILKLKTGQRDDF